MTNYNDFDLDMQISQSKNGISPRSTGSIYTQWDCTPTQISEMYCTEIATICWECETSDICGDGSGDEKSISQCRSYCGCSC